MPEQLRFPANCTNENEPSALQRMSLAELSCVRPPPTACQPWQSLALSPTGQACVLPPPHAESEPVRNHTTGDAQALAAIGPPSAEVPASAFAAAASDEPGSAAFWAALGGPEQPVSKKTDGRKKRPRRNAMAQAFTRSGCTGQRHSYDGQGATMHHARGIAAASYTTSTMGPSRWMPARIAPSLEAVIAPRYTTGAS